MDIPSSPIISTLALHLRDEFGIQNFVETGTYLATTALWASQQFRQVYTIEAAQDFWQQAIDQYRQIPNIRFLFGDSRSHLENLAPNLDGATLFWLDAHWSGGKTFGAQDECPLLNELDAIHTLAHENFILIDDARLFLSPPPRPHDAQLWPDLVTVITGLTRGGKADRYTLVLQDVIVSVPGFARPVVQAYAQEISTQLWAARAVAPRKPFLKRLASLIKGLLTYHA